MNRAAIIAQLRRGECVGENRAHCSTCAKYDSLVAALRALPVIETCGACGHVGVAACFHPTVRGAFFVSHEHAPPKACPLRGKP